MNSQSSTNLPLRSIIGAILLSLAAASAPGQNLTFTWDPNTDAVTRHYRLYRSVTNVVTMAGTVTHPIVTITITGQGPGTTTLYFLTAVDSALLESPPSNVVTNILPKGVQTPANLRKTSP